MVQRVVACYGCADWRVVNQKRKKRSDGLMGEGISESEMKELMPESWQNEVAEETKGADSRDRVKHSERSDQCGNFQGFGGSTSLVHVFNHLFSQLALGQRTS